MKGKGSCWGNVGRGKETYSFISPIFNLNIPIFEIQPDNENLFFEQVFFLKAYENHLIVPLFPKCCPIEN
jgi:hypothetical protein